MLKDNKTPAREQRRTTINSYLYGEQPPPPTTKRACVVVKLLTSIPLNDSYYCGESIQGAGPISATFPYHSANNGADKKVHF